MGGHSRWVWPVRQIPGIHIKLITQVQKALSIPQACGGGAAADAGRPQPLGVARAAQPAARRSGAHFFGRHICGAALPAVGAGRSGSRRRNAAAAAGAAAAGRQGAHHRRPRGERVR